MILNIGCNIRVETQDRVPLTLILQPRSGAAQQVTSSVVTISPMATFQDFINEFGTLCQRTVLNKGASAIDFMATVQVPDVIDIGTGVPLTPVEDLPDDVLRYLLPSRYCQSDFFIDSAAGYVKGATPGYDQVEAIRQWIHQNIRYQYGVSNGSTSAIDTQKARAGVCRDFAHLGIALCRALGIPARMVFGYLHGLDPMDLHAWFEAFVGGRWYTFDATQEAPRGNRVVIAYGRDAADTAQISEYGPLKVSSQSVWVNPA